MPGAAPCPERLASHCSGHRFRPAMSPSGPRSPPCATRPPPEPARGPGLQPEARQHARHQELRHGAGRHLGRRADGARCARSACCVLRWHCAAPCRRPPIAHESGSVCPGQRLQARVEKAQECRAPPPPGEVPLEARSTNLKMDCRAEQLPSSSPAVCLSPCAGRAGGAARRGGGGRAGVC